MGTPVWSRDGGLCTGESYQAVVKLTFFKGASLKDPAKLFNSSLEGNVRRAIDIHEGETIDANAFKALVRAAVALNRSSGKTAAKKKVAKKTAKKAAKATLLTGGNPQITKGDGNAPVKAFLAALPGWKRGVARRLDALIVRTVPGVRKQIRWNSPFYGVEGQGSFLGFHSLKDSLKVAFFRGASLRPEPPGKSKQKEVRYLDLHEDDPLDEAQLASWIRQAAALPGWNL